MNTRGTQHHVCKSRLEIPGSWRNGQVGRHDSGSVKVTDSTAEKAIADELRRAKPALQRILIKAIEADHVVPASSASLGYIKYMTSLNLPTQFYEAELDYFGKHMYDRRDDNEDEAPTEGKHHFAWIETES